MTKLIATFCASLRMYQRYLTVVSLGVLVATRIFSAVIIDPLSKCPTLLSSFFYFHCYTVHDVESLN